MQVSKSSSVKDLKSLLTLKNRLAEKARIELHRIEKEIQEVSEWLKAKQNQFTIIRLTPSETRNLRESDMDSIYYTNALTADFEPIARQKVDLVGVDPFGKRLIFVMDGIQQKSTELFIFRKN